MTNDQRKHVDLLAKRAGLLLKSKYERGAAEHDGNLWECGALFLVDSAIDEAIDQLTYLLTLKDKLTNVGRVDDISAQSGTGPG